MTSSPATGQEYPEAVTDRHSDAMEDQVRGAVESEAASHPGAAADPDAAADPANAGVEASRQRPAPAARAPRPKAKPAEAVAPAVAEKKPFKMSYDGTTDKDYMAQRLKLGAR